MPHLGEYMHLYCSYEYIFKVTLIFIRGYGRGKVHSDLKEFVMPRKNKCWGVPECKGTQVLMIRMAQLCLFQYFNFLTDVHFPSVSEFLLKFYNKCVPCWTRWVRLFLRTIYHFKLPGSLALGLEHVAETDCLVEMRMTWPQRSLISSVLMKVSVTLSEKSQETWS